MRMVDLIEKKVDGGALSHDEIETMIEILDIKDPVSIFFARK